MRRETVKIILALCVIVPAGLALKFLYHGPGDVWAHRYGAAVLYEVFWVLVLRLFARDVSPLAAAAWVFSITCLLEVLQLWHPTPLRALRSTFFGAVLLGTTFDPLDFPHYALGCGIGYLGTSILSKTTNAPPCSPGDSRTRGGDMSRDTTIAMLLAALLLAWIIVPISLCAGEEQQQLLDLAKLSFEELLAVEVVSASKKAEKLFEAATAIYVITREDIRRSGVTSIPEALRMVPGMEVAHIDANKWAVTARGFNDLFANKLLVLIDGRSVYTPLFSGVFWEAQDVLMEDVERIEVIRGPGATLWGANAVNGIINILTRSAKDTQGGVVVTGLGSEERGSGRVRYGDTLGEDAYYRVYAKYALRDGFVDASGEEASDRWRVLQGGFRMDWQMSARDALTIQGDVYGGEVGQTYRINDSLESPYTRTLDVDVPIAGGDLLGRWNRRFSDASDMTLQLYYDRMEREDVVIEGYLHKLDLDLQYRLGMGMHQEIVCGLGYRFMSDELKGSFAMSVSPESRTHGLISGFLQDEIALVDDRFRVTLGAKLEYNEYTGLEVQPNVRALWMPYDQHAFWGSISRAIRTPSRVEEDMRAVRQVLPPNPSAPDVPTALVVFGSREFESEELLAFELGYRVHPTDRASLDLATFCNVYDELLTIEPGAPFRVNVPPEHWVVPLAMDNKMKATAWGAELSSDAQILDRWRLRANYTYLRVESRLYRGSQYTAERTWEGVSPRHQWSLRSSLDLPGGLALDLGARYVDDLPYIDVESYAAFDIRLGWRPIGALEVSLVGQNLFEEHHLEFRAPHTPAVSTEVERGVYGSIRWRF